MEPIVQSTIEHVLDDGHVVNYMGPDVAADAAYAYTTGRPMCGRPDLLISGPFAIPDIKAMLDEAVALDDAEPLQVGRTIEVRDREMRISPCVTVPLHASSAMFGLGRFEALQLLWSAPNGCWPGEPDYDVPAQVQTIYGA